MDFYQRHFLSNSISDFIQYRYDYIFYHAQASSAISFPYNNNRRIFLSLLLFQNHFPFISLQATGQCSQNVPPAGYLHQPVAGSCFCPTCGNKYSMERTTSMSFKLVNVQHRHCVFTIDENLRDFFLEDRTLLDCLFHSVTSVVSRMFFKMNKSKNYTPGFIMVLHTFGRDLKWNPHIHCLISEGGYSDDGFWRPVHHFNYTYLRNAFRTALLDEMGRRLGSSFKKIKSQCYTNHKEGFYVYAKPNKCDPETVIKYIGRYLGRPVIATSRIDSYDEDSETVTFHYNRHEDDKYIQETIPALDFIRHLIRHIPEKHFKMIRYGGLYARHREIDKNLHLAISKAKRHTLRDFNKWRTAILSSFGYDPLKCPDCKHEMLFLELYFNHKRVSLEEMYEKIMSKARRRWSSA